MAQIPQDASTALVGGARDRLDVIRESTFVMNMGEGYQRGRIIDCFADATRHRLKTARLEIHQFEFELAATTFSTTGENIQVRGEIRPISDDLDAIP